MKWHCYQICWQTCTYISQAYFSVFFPTWKKGVGRIGKTYSWRKGSLRTIIFLLFVFL